MAAAAEEGTAAAAAAAEQLGSLSLDETAVERRNDNDSEATATTATETTMCSACGAKSDALKKCNGCLCVWYCDRKCQNKHRKLHKLECKRIKTELDRRGGKLDLGTEKDIGPLGEVPPREECPICMHVLPIHQMLHAFSGCCGKTICGGCNLQHQTKSVGRTQDTCAFCREPIPRTDKECLARLIKRVKLKDPKALHSMAMHFLHGRLGLPMNQAKCIDLMRQAAALGNAVSQYQLATFHRTGEMGLGQNEEESRKYMEQAAEGGYLMARYNLGVEEHNKGNRAGAMRHLRLSAAGGAKWSMDSVIAYFEYGLLHHDDLAETLQSAYRARAELKSNGRDQYIAHLKETGEYEAEYEM